MFLLLRRFCVYNIVPAAFDIVCLIYCFSSLSLSLSLCVLFSRRFHLNTGSPSQPVRHVRSTGSLPERRHLHQHGHWTGLRVQKSRLRWSLLRERWVSIANSVLLWIYFEIQNVYRSPAMNYADAYSCIEMILRPIKTLSRQSSLNSDVLCRV